MEGQSQNATEQAASSPPQEGYISHQPINTNSPVVREKIDAGRR